jgi:signal transduction histidine kinase
VGATLAEVAPLARRHRVVGLRAGTAVWVRADRRRVGEVLAGLVHNATKYAPQRTRITVRLEKHADRAIVRVSDQGPGVPPHERNRMFEPYARGDHTGIPGTGIGLFASRRVIEAQGGDIWYEEGEGATFAFSIPTAREEKR